ncbi:MAG: VOC family protein [Acidobacteriota bacterium]
MRRALPIVLSLLSLPVFAQSQDRPAITGVAFIRVYTTDPAAAQTFYGHTLGYNRIEAGDAWVYTVNRLQWVEVLQHTPPPDPNSRLAAIGFTTRDTAALERYLKAHDVAIVQPLHDGEFSVRDPEGHLIYFVQSVAPKGTAKLVAAAPPSLNAASHRIIHVGFVVRDKDKENAFYRTLLGFKPYWFGGQKDGQLDYMSQQVPEGTDWLEYMLHSNPNPTLQTNGGQNHFSLGVADIHSVLGQLERNGCADDACRNIHPGRDGKIQLNLFDPDHTRAEFMEFKPVLKPCCSPFTGPPPGPEESR